MTKEQVTQKIKEILSKDDTFDISTLKIKFRDKKNKKEKIK